MSNSFRLVDALLSKPVDRVPVWMMRQAGRYLPEYLKLREAVPDFVAFCKNSELAAEATVQPIDRFDLDAAILFCDILVIPEAMGMNLQFIKGEGPVFSKPIINQQDLQSLNTVDAIEKLAYVPKTISLVKEKLNNRVPLIGFAGSPWTVACYMVEGGSSNQFATIRQMQYKAPHLLHELLEKLTQVSIDYLNQQIAAGVDVIQIFDSWGGLLSPELYQQFSLQYMNKIASNLDREVNGKRIPVTFFSKGAVYHLVNSDEKKCDAIGVDWTLDLSSVYGSCQSQGIAVQGNLDPFELFSSDKEIHLAVKKILSSLPSLQGYVFNLGHGIDKDTPIEAVKTMIAAVREFGLMR